MNSDQGSLNVRNKSASATHKITTTMICAFKGKQKRHDKVYSTVMRRETSNSRALRAAMQREEYTNTVALKKTTKGRKARQAHR